MQNLIMAVLGLVELLLQNQDAYLKSAGGVKLDEPAIDLAVASGYCTLVTRAAILRNVCG